MKKVVFIILFSFFLLTPVFGATDVKNDATLSNNLVSYWELEESSGTRIDSHGANDLTDNNTVTSGTGKQGTAADFERDNSEYLSITDGSQSGLDITGDMSISLWYKPESGISGTSHTFISKAASSGQYSYQYYYTDDGGTPKLFVFLSNNGSSFSLGGVAATLTADGSWYHIVMAYDASAGTVDCYVDGSSVGQITAQKTSLFNSTSDVVIGANNAGGSEVDGLVDEFAIWDRLLDSSDVTALYNSGSGLPYEATGGRRRIITF